MLKPAVLYKDEIEHKFAEWLYTDEFYFYTGYAHANVPPVIEPSDNVYQYAIVNEDNLLGYFGYTVQPDTDCVYNFGWYSFEPGNTMVVTDVLHKMEELIKDYRRIEWKMIGGNKVAKYYKRFCKKHNGNYVRLTDVCKDTHGKYHDEYIFEIVH